ncbi:hypothetical protein C4D60_Mb08t18640 [Musa balbisiana]|uniref:Uncharacterized protein n=1 Tax=Musa balbisiana TaxID=52838 RepID=A0A4S8K4S6_MUSBA|nr:hypothetical protein C4D60_Mb08t18640 [Musa balbisiana]
MKWEATRTKTPKRKRRNQETIAYLALDYSMHIHLRQDRKANCLLMHSAYAGFWVYSFQFSRDEDNMLRPCQELRHGLVQRKDNSEHDILKSRVLLNWGNINFDSGHQSPGERSHSPLQMDTNHQVREATHHFKVIVFQAYSKSKHATINRRPGRLMGNRGHVEPVSGTHARGGRALRRAGCACGFVRGGLTR